MGETELNNILQRQLKRLGLNDNTPPTSLDSWHELIDRINKRYNHTDQERYLLERSMDISSRELIDLNEKLENAQRIAQIGHWVYDRANEKITWSKEMYRLFGFDALLPIPAYDDIMKLVHENDRQEIHHLVAQAFAEGIGYEREIRIRRPNGDYWWFQVRAQITPSESGKVLTGVMMNITKRKIAEEEIQSLHQQLLTTARQAGMADVAAAILHNVGNVLNSANVSVELLKETVESQKFENLVSILKMINEHDDTVDSFLTLDEKGKLIPKYLSALSEIIDDQYQTFKQETLNLVKSIQHIKEIVAKQNVLSSAAGFSERVFLPEISDMAIDMSGIAAAEKNITIEKDYKDSVFASIDKANLLQILINLLTNAKDSIFANPPDKEKLIKITVKKCDQPSVMQIIVEDSGVGITPENFGKIFTWGFTTKPQGHGFGLHNSALKAKEMGGSLTAQSKGVGQGATFTITLPLDDKLNTQNK